MAEMRNTTPGTAQAVSHPSRRQLMGCAVLVAFGGGGGCKPGTSLSDPDTVPAAESPGAELIDLCASCDALQDHVDALHFRPSDDMSIDQELAWEQARDVLVEPISDRQEILFERICELEATTLQGHMARARTLLGWDKDLCRTSDYHCWSEHLVGAVIRDLTAAV